MADWRLRGIPPPLWRKVRDKAGDRLQQVLIGLLRAYADGEIDPLALRASSLDVVATSGGKVTTEIRGRADLARPDRMTDDEVLELRAQNERRRLELQQLREQLARVEAQRQAQAKKAIGS